MRDISKANFYISYFQAAQKLTDDAERVAFYDALLAYIFEGVEPVNLPFGADLLFTAIRANVDADIKRKNGGAPVGNNNASKNKEVENNPKTTSKQPQNNPKTTHCFEKTNNVDVDDNEEVNEEGDENGNDDENNLVDEVDITLPLSYSTKIFNIFKNAGFPCANGNKLAFLQRDFKNGLSFLHSKPELKNLHSSDVLGACENYAKTVADPRTYLTNKYSFDRFVGIKNFMDFIPDNFDINNFLRFDLKNEPPPKPEEPKTDIMADLHAPTSCECGCETLTQYKHDLIVKCESCGAWAEYNKMSGLWDWQGGGK